MDSDDDDSDDHAEPPTLSGQFDGPDDSEKPLHATRSSAAALELGTMQLNAEPNLEVITGGEAPSTPSVEKSKRKKLPPPYTSNCKYHFERVILDECQYVKSIRTCAHQSIAQIPLLVRAHRDAHVESNSRSIWLL